MIKLKIFLFSIVLSFQVIAGENIDAIDQQWQGVAQDFLAAHQYIQERLLDDQDIPATLSQDYQKKADNFWHAYGVAMEAATPEDQLIIEELRHSSQVLRLGLQDLTATTLDILRFFVAKEAMVAAVNNPEFTGDIAELTTLIQEIDQYSRSDIPGLTTKQQALVQLMIGKKKEACRALDLTHFCSSGT